MPTPGSASRSSRTLSAGCPRNTGGSPTAASTRIRQPSFAGQLRGRRRRCVRSTPGAVRDRIEVRDVVVGGGHRLRGAAERRPDGNDHRRGSPQAGLDTGAIPRSLSHFGAPPQGDYGLVLFDGDGVAGLSAILTKLYPPFADAAVLIRPSASASVKDPKTGAALKVGEHFMPCSTNRRSRRSASRLFCDWHGAAGRAGSC